MRAAIFLEQNGPLSVEDVQAIDPGPRDVVVRVTASGVCHSDVHVVSGALPVPPPAILGHEGCGIVEAVGREVTRVSVGDRVIGSFIPACGSCWFCLRDQSHLCANTYGVMGAPRASRKDRTPLVAMAGLGTFADRMTCDEMSLVKIETDVPDEQLALIGCGVTTGVGAALNTANVKAGDTVAVIGCGGVGQSVIQGARIAGAARIIAIDPVEMKRTAAMSLGATDVIDPDQGNAVEQVQALTAGIGVDYAFEVIGTPATVEQAFAMARNGGAAVAVGVSRFDQSITIPSFPLVLSEKRLLGCMYGSAQVRRDFPRLVSLVEQKTLDLEHMVTRTMPLDDINEAFRAMKDGEVIRSVLVQR
jgi:S-(hydroxymethyl)glutathione dehydrogenase/alcohol dehydrogenase